MFPQPQLENIYYMEAIKLKDIIEKTLDVNILRAQEKIEKTLGLKIHISHKKNNSGKVSIQYKDLDQFELISDLLTKH